MFEMGEMEEHERRATSKRLRSLTLLLKTTQGKIHREERKLAKKTKFTQPRDCVKVKPCCLGPVAAKYSKWDEYSNALSDQIKRRKLNRAGKLNAHYLNNRCLHCSNATRDGRLFKTTGWALRLYLCSTCYNQPKTRRRHCYRATVCLKYCKDVSIEPRFFKGYVKVAKKLWSSNYHLPGCQRNKKN